MFLLYSLRVIFCVPFMNRFMRFLRPVCYSDLFRQHIIRCYIVFNSVYVYCLFLFFVNNCTKIELMTYARKKRVLLLLVKVYAMVGIFLPSATVTGICLGFVTRVVTLKGWTVSLAWYVLADKMCRAKYVGVATESIRKSPYFHCRSFLPRFLSLIPSTAYHVCFFWLYITPFCEHLVPIFDDTGHLFIYVLIKIRPASPNAAASTSSSHCTYLLLNELITAIPKCFSHSVLRLLVGILVK